MRNASCDVRVRSPSSDGIRKLHSSRTALSPLWSEAAVRAGPPLSSFYCLRCAGVVPCVVVIAVVAAPVRATACRRRPSTATSKLKLTTPDNLSCQRPRSGTLLEARALDHCAQIALNFQRDYSDTPDPGPYAFADHLPDTRLDRVTMLSRLLYLMLEFRISRGHPQPVLCSFPVSLTFVFPGRYV